MSAGAGEDPMGHTPTIVREGGDCFTIFCSCTWRTGERHDSEMSARMAWAMDHMADEGNRIIGDSFDTPGDRL